MIDLIRFNQYWGFDYKVYNYNPVKSPLYRLEEKDYYMKRIKKDVFMKSVSKLLYKFIKKEIVRLIVKYVDITISIISIAFPVWFKEIPPNPWTRSA